MAPRVRGNYKRVREQVQHADNGCGDACSQIRCSGNRVCIHVRFWRQEGGSVGGYVAIGAGAELHGCA